MRKVFASITLAISLLAGLATANEVALASGAASEDSQVVLGENQVHNQKAIITAFCGGSGSMAYLSGSITVSDGIIFSGYCWPNSTGLSFIYKTGFDGSLDTKFKTTTRVGYIQGLILAPDQNSFYIWFDCGSYQGCPWDMHEVSKYSLDGNVIWTKSLGQNYIAGISMTPDGSLVLTDNKNFYFISTLGVLTSQFVPTQSQGYLSAPISCADGTTYFAKWQSYPKSFSLWRLSSDGWQYGNPITTTTNGAITGSNLKLACDSDSHPVFLVSLFDNTGLSMAIVGRSNATTLDKSFGVSGFINLANPWPELENDFSSTQFNLLGLGNGKLAVIASSASVGKSQAVYNHPDRIALVGSSGLKTNYVDIPTGLACKTQDCSTLPPSISLDGAGNFMSLRTSRAKDFSKSDVEWVRFNIAPPYTEIVSDSPTIVGNPNVGSDLFVNTGIWESGSSLNLQWLRDGLPIEGGNSAWYTLTPSDYQRKISIQIIGSKAGRISATQTSEQSVIESGKLSVIGNPSIYGPSHVSGQLEVSPGRWNSEVEFSYQWLRDGVAISDATSSSYFLTEEDYQHQISVQLIGSRSGYESVTTTSNNVYISSGRLVDLPTPVLTGLRTIGSILTVSPNTSGTTVQYRWLRNGLETGQVGNSYTLTFADLGSDISVRATYSKLGYDDFSATSAALQVATTIPNTACAAPLDKSAWLTSPGAQPVVSGNSAFGSKLSGVTGSWTSGTKLCSYWYSNGNAIAGAMSSSYKSQSSDIGQQVQYVVIGTDKAGKSALRYSQPITITKATLTSAKPPKVTGVGKVGVKLSGSVTNWTAGVNYSYQWLRNGNPINGAQSSTYVANSDDLGTALSLQACGSKEYFETLCLTSSGTSVIKGTISPAPTVKIIGSSTKPGAVLTGIAGNWSSGVSITIQWFRDGSAIQGETDGNHTITQSDRGHSLTFQVTGTASGYTDCVKVSAAKKIP
jgi:hypothetical protein